MEFFLKAYATVDIIKLDFLSPKFSKDSGALPQTELLESKTEDGHQS